MLLSALCLCGKEALLKYFKAVTGTELTPGIIAVIQSFGSKINLHPHLHFLTTEGGEDKQGRFHKVIDKIIRHLKLTFHAERPPPPQIAQKELLMAAEERGRYF